MIEITLDLLIKYLGPPERKRGVEYVWQCPYCLDSHKDNLTYNAQKGIVYCFASEGEHSRQLIKNIISNETKNNPKAWKEFLENKYQNIKKISKEKEEKASIIYEDEKQLEFVNYAAINMISLMGNLEALTVLLEKRGITKETAMNVVLGYDTQKRRWVIPTIKYSTEYTAYLIGFEYRPLDFSKDGISRERGTPTGLAQINAFNDQKNLIVVEGYFDGYVLYQHLTEQNKINEYHIVTCSNGVSGLLNQLSVINFDKYEKFYLLIDNDETSIPIATKICNKYPKIINLSTKMFKDCGCKDFNEHYLKCIYNKRISSRYNLEDIKKIKNINELINYVKDKEATIYPEKINKGYSLEKAGNMEKIILECINNFNGEFNKSVLAKILSGELVVSRIARYGKKVTDSKFYGLYSPEEYYNIRKEIDNLLRAQVIFSENNRKWGKIYIRK